MKIKGIELTKPEPRPLVIPHGDVVLVFMADYIDDLEEYDKLAPKPPPPEKVNADGSKELDVTHPKYMEGINKWLERRFNWIYYRSLSATEGLEWEFFNAEDPTTWDKFEEEFEHIPPQFVERLKYHVLETCGLDDSRIEEATARFLAERRLPAAQQTSQSIEP